MEKLLSKMNIGNIVSFSLHVDSVITQNYEHVKIIGIFPADACDPYDDVYATHAQVFRLLPEGLAEDDASSYPYLLVETELKERRVIGLPWIDYDTVRVHDRSLTSFSAYNMSQEDIEAVSDFFARRGYKPTIKTSRI